jgi:hypothetical protein
MAFSWLPSNEDSQRTVEELNKLRIRGSAITIELAVS